MGFLDYIAGFFLFCLFGGSSYSGRYYGGLFGGRKSPNSGWKPTRGRDFWAEKYQKLTSTRRSKPYNPFSGHSRPSIPRRVYSRNMPRDPWEKKYNKVMGTPSQRRRYGTSSLLGTGTRRRSSYAWPLWSLGANPTVRRRHHGNPITDNYYGMHGEFDLNDAMRANMEDMEQFRSVDPYFDPKEHGYDWDEVMDALNDGYIDD